MRRCNVSCSETELPFLFNLCLPLISDYTYFFHFFLGASTRSSTAVCILWSSQDQAWLRCSLMTGILRPWKRSPVGEMPLSLWEQKLHLKPWNSLLRTTSTSSRSNHFELSVLAKTRWRNEYMSKNIWYSGMYYGMVCVCEPFWWNSYDYVILS